MISLPRLSSLTALALLLASQSAGANEYAALLKAKKFPEVERAANARLAKEPANIEAMIARVDAIMEAGAQSRIDEAVKQAKHCVNVSPGSSGCHLAVGKSLGWKAMNGGVMSALGYAGDMRDAFKKAVELEPRNMDARFSLLQFYMMAPGIMGGGTGKAETLAAETMPISAEAARVMTGMLDVKADRVAKAEAAVMAMRPGADEQLNERQENLMAQIGNKHLTDKRFADAERVLREAHKRFPDGDTAPYLLARAHQEQGKHREALAALEAMLPKHPRARVHYRMGQSLQALGDKAKAAGAFEKAVALRAGLSDKQIADAQTQVSALKG